MCGIGLLALLGDARESEETARWNQLLSRALAKRGPDLPMRSCASGGADGSTVTMHASVLHMRGREPSPQPARFLVSEELECTLCWNGEAYAYCDSPGSDSKGSDSNADVGVSVDQDMIELVDNHEEESDTRVVIDLLKGSLSESMSAEKEHEAVSLALSCIHGEFAFILCVPRSNSTSIYFGRDCLGRRSLLVSRFDGVLALSSVSVDLSGTSAWTEIRPGTVFRIDMKSGEETEKPIPKMTNGCIPAMIPRQFSDDRIDEAARGLLLCLDKAVERRVAHPPSPKSQSTNDASVAVLFSGGIDSVVLAALSHRHVPVDQPIDLINVSFFNDPPDASSSKSPDRLAAILSYEEMTTRFPQRKWRFIAVDVVYSQVLENERHILDLIAPLDSTMDFNIGVAFWFASRGEGRLLGSSEVDAARREIEGKSRGGGSTNSSDQPLLRFANSNDSRGECAVEKVEKGDKRAPSSSHSIPDDITGILSSAKILLSGVGADEQMAGYGRHKTTFQRGGYELLREELKMEVGRLWTRNLGRDDRCLSHHGRETRFPYLDEDVVAYLELLPIECKCDFSLPLGSGDKRILRLVARMIGVTECSTLVKRAIQFGSRIAKVSDKNRFGSSRKATGQSKIVRSRKGS